jgi:hypothetical protein
MSDNLKSTEDWFVYYVASPYSHPNPEIRKERYELAVKSAKTLTRLGYSAFVPIAYDGLWDLDPNYTVDHSWSFWEKIDLPILDRCAALILLELPDWDASRGVAGELEHCEKVGIPVMCISLSDLENDQIIHRKMSILKGMIRRNKRDTPPKFKAEDKNSSELIKASWANTNGQREPF